MRLSTKRKKILAVIVPLELAGAVIAWRDLARRTDGQVRGGKRVWRALVILNPGNSMLYWLFGRR